MSRQTETTDLAMIAFAMAVIILIAAVAAWIIV